MNFSLIPFWGNEGAAIAIATSRMVWNLILLLYRVWKRMGIVSTALESHVIKGKL